MSGALQSRERIDRRTRVALIGAGGIARAIDAYAQSSDRCEVVAVLSRAVERDAAHWPRARLVSSRAQMLECRPQVVVECAGHAAVCEHVPAIMEAGVDVIVASSGALADSATFDRVRSMRGRAQLIVPAGALPGIDGLAAAALDSLCEVRLVSSKPPRSWAGTPAAEAVDLEALVQPYVLFRGNAREAAQAYPKNANVAATVALAGIGFERTVVELVADPAATGNCHRLEARGTFGSLTVNVTGAASGSNPRTSRLTAFAIIRAIESRTAVIVL